MFGPNSSDGPRPKCFFTEQPLPTFLNHDQPPTKKKPFSTILNQSLNQTLEIILPKSSYQKLTPLLPAPQPYQQIYVKALSLLTNPFFTSYIKTPSSNILLTTSQNPSSSTPTLNALTLASGTLTLDLSKPTYQRTGLTGQCIPSGGHKHVKERFAISVDLRAPNMVHGKKGFERLRWACENVLVESVGCLMLDLRAGEEREAKEGILKDLGARERVVQMDAVEMDGTRVPVWGNGWGAEEEEEEVMEWLEWVNLVLVGSDRVRMDAESVDPVLCRYQGPEEASVQDLVKVRWRGLLSAEWITSIYLALCKASGNQWFAMSTTSFKTDIYTIVQTDNKTLIWEYAD